MAHGFWAVDLGATTIRLACIRDSEMQVTHFSTPAPEALPAILTMAVRDMGGAAAGRPIGLSRAPAIGSDGRVVAWPNRPDWVRGPLLDILSDTLGGGPVCDADDGACAALWEHVVSGGRDVTAALSFGTGLGIGAAANGGVIPLGDGGDTLAHEAVPGVRTVCRCGRRGCLQMVLTPRDKAADPGMVRDGIRRAATHLRDLCGVTLVVLTGGRISVPNASFTAVPENVQDVRIRKARHPELSSLAGACLLADEEKSNAPGVLAAMIRNARWLNLDRQYGGIGHVDP